MTTTITAEELGQLGWLLTNAPTEALWELIIQENPSMAAIDLEQARQQFYDRMLIPYSAIYIPPFKQVYKKMALDDSIVHFPKPDWQEDKEIANWFRRYGFSIQKLEKDSVLAQANIACDHLGFMLSFCAYLLHCRTTENETKNDLKNFVTIHLGIWVDQYLNLQQLESQYHYPVWVAGLVEEGVNQLRIDLGLRIV